MNKRSYETSSEGCCEIRAVDADAVARVGAALARERLSEEAALFGALGDVTRLTILVALAAEPLCVCDLAALTGVTQSCVSHQLRALRELRLVTFAREGRRAVYRLADDHVATLLAVGAAHAAESAAGEGSP